MRASITDASGRSQRPARSAYLGVGLPPQSLTPSASRPIARALNPEGAGVRRLEPIRAKATTWKSHAAGAASRALQAKKDAVRGLVS